MHFSVLRSFFFFLPHLSFSRQLFSQRHWGSLMQEIDGGLPGLLTTPKCCTPHPWCFVLLIAASLPVISPPVSEQLGIALQSLSYNMTNMFSFKGTKETEINERITKQEFSFPFRGDHEYPASVGHGHHGHSNPQVDGPRNSRRI